MHDVARFPHLILPGDPGFTLPFNIVAKSPIGGWQQAKQVRNPLAAQPAAHPAHHPLFERAQNNTNFSPHAQALREAMASIDTNPAETGRRCRAIREAIDRERRPGDGLTIVRGGALPPEYITATFLEAALGPVDSETLDALERIVAHAEDNHKLNILADAQLYCATAQLRLGHDGAAAATLTKILERPLSSDPHFQVRVIELVTNILMNRAMTHTHVEHRDALDQLTALYVTTIPALVSRQTPPSPLFAQQLGPIYRMVGEFLLMQREPMYIRAIMIARSGHALFPESPILAELFAHETAAVENETGVEKVAELADHKEPFLAGISHYTIPILPEPVDDQALSPLARLIRHHDNHDATPLGTSLAAAATEFLRQCRFPNPRAAWGAAAAGSAVGTATGSAVALGLGFDPTAAGRLGSSLGATLAIGLGHAWHALQSPAVAEAAAAGYSNHDLSAAATAELLKLGGTAVGFGGYGLGILVEYFVGGAVHHLADLGSALAHHGVVDGLHQFGGQAADQNIGFRTFGKSVEFASHLSNWWQAYFGKPITNLPGMGFALDPQTPAAVTALIETAYAYMGLSMVYSFATVSKSVAGQLAQRLPEGTEKVFLPGAILGSTAAIAYYAKDSGLLTQALALASVGLAVATKLRGSAQGGRDLHGMQGMIKDLFCGRLSGRELTSIMGALAVPLINIAPGAAVLPHLELPHQWWMHLSDTGHFLQQCIEANMGALPMLIGLGVVPALLTDASIEGTLLSKLYKGYSYEQVANLFKVAIGWNHPLSHIIHTLVKEWGWGAAITMCFPENGGSRQQRRDFRSNAASFAKYAKAEADAAQNPVRIDLKTTDRADRLEQLQTAALQQHDREIADARLGKLPNPAQPVGTIGERLAAVATQYYLPVEPQWQALTRPRPAMTQYLDTVYAALTSDQVSEREIGAHLDRLAVIASDAAPHLADVRHNLILATALAAAHPQHGKQLQEFFSSRTGQALLETYHLEPAYLAARALPPTKKSHWWSSRKSTNVAPALFKEHCRKPVDPAEQRYYNGVETAGRRHAFSGPLTGRTVREILEPLYAIYASLKGDAAKQTTAGRPLYHGTLFQLFMRDVPSSQRAEYVKSFVEPTLEAFRRIASHVGDNRYDVRHNLLLVLRLAKNGPFANELAAFERDHRALFTAHDIDGRCVGIPQDQFPTTRKATVVRKGEKLSTRKLFDRLLLDSTVSADGQIVYPVAPMPDLGQALADSIDASSAAATRVATAVSSTPGDSGSGAHRLP